MAMLKKISILAAFMLITVPAWAEGPYHIKNKTPEIQNAFEQRKARSEDLHALKAKGVLGEDNHGYLKVFENSGESLANSENKDRRVIYEAIVQQNNLGPGNLGQVERTFAEVRRDKARPGDRIQTPSGDWTTK
jgi:uncharacterized protein YdbL (DUF1318 family)